MRFDSGLQSLSSMIICSDFASTVSPNQSGFAITALAGVLCVHKKKNSVPARIYQLSVLSNTDWQLHLVFFFYRQGWQWRLEVNIPTGTRSNSWPKMAKSRMRLKKSRYDMVGAALEEFGVAEGSSIEPFVFDESLATLIWNVVHLFCGLCTDCNFTNFQCSFIFGIFEGQCFYRN